MTKSKTDKHLTLSYKKTISKSDLQWPKPLKGVGNRKIDVFKELTPHSADLLSFAAKEKNKQIK